METRKLGHTGIDLPVLSFGASSIGHAFRNVRYEDALESVRVALELGLFYIDTSPFYGRGISEVLLGIALRDIPRAKFVISTKLGRYDSDKFDFRADRVYESVDVSLFRLGLDYLDIVLCHDVEFVTLSQIVQETLPALRELQRQGKVRAIGISGFPLKIFRAIVEQTDIDVILSYCHYTLQNRRLLDLAPLLESKGVGIINASPFGMRLLSDSPIPDWHPASPQLRETCARAAQFCRDRGAEISKLALQLAVRAPAFCSCLAGSGNPDNIHKWVRWIEEPDDPEMMAEVEAILAPVMNQVWLSGRPENND